MSALLSSLSEFPHRVRELLEGLSHDQITTKASVEEFSFAEHVCHLRDIEAEGYLVRVRRMLTEEKPHLSDIDGTRLAIERYYNREDVVAAWEAFSEARKESVDLLSEIDEVHLLRKAELEGVGEISLQRLVEMMHDHDVGHLEEMMVLRRRLLNAAAG